MNVTTVLDSYAWIEYFAGTQKGRVLRDLLNSGESLCTPSICLLEVKSKYLRERQPSDDLLAFVCQRSRIADLNKDIALKAADEKQENGLHTADAIVYATAKHVKGELLTGDAHFSKLPFVKML